MASLYQLLLSILRLVSLIIIAVQSYTPKFPEGLCSLSIKHALSGARKSLNAFGSTGGSLCCRIPGHTLSSPSALFTTPEGISSDEKSPNFIQRKKESKLPDLSPLTFSDFHSVTRTQANDEIKHLELYLKWRKGGSWWAFAIRFLPQFLRPKPSAKTGVRTYISSSIMMDNLVISCFGQSALRQMSDEFLDKPDGSVANSNILRDDAGNVTGGSAKNKNTSSNSKTKRVGPTSTGSANTKWAARTDRDSIAIVGLFVYMWIAPILRKRQLGDILLEKGKQMCRDLGAGFMILVHDDDGSGKLVDYYKDRDFKPIFDVIDKGMLGKL